MVLVALSSCRSQGESEAPTLPPPPAAATVASPDSPGTPPGEQADESTCRAACLNVANLAATRELSELRELDPRLVPTGVGHVKQRIGGAIGACIGGCVRSTPRGVATCLSTAKTADAARRCAPAAR